MEDYKGEERRKGVSREELDYFILETESKQIRLEDRLVSVEERIVQHMEEYQKQQVIESGRNERMIVLQEKTADSLKDISSTMEKIHLRIDYVEDKVDNNSLHHKLFKRTVFAWIAGASFVIGTGWTILTQLIG
jgi:hypothetical protein